MDEAPPKQCLPGCATIVHPQHTTYTLHDQTGIGGGANQNGWVKAETALQAAQTPYFGISANPYQRALDPFLNAEVAGYRDYFYQQVSAYLKGACNATTSYASATADVFIWNLLSWDVQGIYPPSNSPEGSYRSPATMAIVNQHNCVDVQGKPVCAPGQQYAADCSCVSGLPVTVSG